MGIAPDLTAAQWRKSSYSGDTGGDCIEVAALSGARWRKSSYSSDTGGECIEGATAEGIAAIRDSKDPEGPVLTFTPEAFSSFVTSAANGTFARI